MIVRDAPALPPLLPWAELTEASLRAFERISAEVSPVETPHTPYPLRFVIPPSSILYSPHPPPVVYLPLHLTIICQEYIVLVHSSPSYTILRVIKVCLQALTCFMLDSGFSSNPQLPHSTAALFYWVVVACGGGCGRSAAGVVRVCVITAPWLVASTGTLH